MIFVKGYGQMCNNILQFAHVYAWGRENNIPVVSMRFAYKYRYFNICKTKYHSWPFYLFAKSLIKTKQIKCHLVDEPKDLTKEVQSDLKEHKLVAIDGWLFRFPDLFQKYRSEIKEQFTMDPKITTRVDNLLAADGNSSTIKLAVHIRRGDYSRWMGGKFFFDDTVYIDYIRQFMQQFPDKQVSVYICTNDKNLKVEHYRQELGIDAVYHYRGTEAEDLYLLSQCDYILGVKSTFSLMAAFYKNLPIYWIMDKNEPLRLNDFKLFDDLYMTV